MPEKNKNNYELTKKLPLKKNKNKSKIIISFIIIVILSGISFVLLENPEIFHFEKTEDKITSMYSDKIMSYNFYPSNYDEDIYEDETYMGLNRYVQFKVGPETYTITDGDYERHGKAAVFFGEYFDAAINGDAERYNQMFTENYYTKNEPYERFTPQKIYDILVEQLSLNSDNGGDTYYFAVSYSIRQNNGTFRNDIDSDASRKLYFKLVTVDSQLKIDDISAKYYEY